MTDIPTHGVFTQPTLMMHTHRTGELSEAYLKRALILFDHLVFIPLGLGNMGGPNEVISKRQWITRLAARNELSAVDRLEEVILLDRDLVKDVEAFQSSLMDSDSGDLWTGTQSDRFIAFVERLVNDDDTIHDKLEMKKFFIGNINYDYRLFRIILRDFDRCTALLSEIHEQAVLTTYGKGTPNPESIIRRVGNLNTFDFAQLSWLNIFRLRESGFVTDFRKKVSEWVISYGMSDDVSAFEQTLARMVDDAKYELIGETEPNVRAAVLSGIGGNLPSPIGVNPISLFGSIRESVRQHRLKKKFGWLFFIQRCRKIASNNTPDGIRR
jgi:hypothetical protein